MCVDQLTNNRNMEYAHLLQSCSRRTFFCDLANMFYIPAGIMALKEYGVEAEGLNWFNFFITNELPVTIGNLIGGISLSVALWFTQSQKAKNNI